MKRISSHFTPIFKFVVPWAAILLFTASTVAALVGRQIYLALAVVVIGAPIIGFSRAMAKKLRTVFLDNERKVLLVKGQPDETISFDEIEEILKPWTPPYIATVQLTKNYSFGKTFSFVPNDTLSFGDNYNDELKPKIRR